jgi:hypothetical protein
MELQFEGALTKDEFLSVSKLVGRPLAREKGKLTFDLWLVLVAAGTVLVVGAIWEATQMQRTYIIWFVLGLILLIIGRELRKVPQKLWEQNEKFRAWREGEVTEDVVEIRTPFGHARFLWTDFIGYGEYKGTVVLFPDTAVGVPFPKRFFKSEAEWDSFQALVASKLQMSHQAISIKLSTILLFVVIAIALTALLVQFRAR